MKKYKYKTVTICKGLSHKLGSRSFLASAGDRTQGEGEVAREHSYCKTALNSCKSQGLAKTMF